MEGKIKIALAQLASTPLETEKNLQRALQWAEQAAEQKADLILFPEMFLTGYLLGKEIGRLAMKADEAPLQTLCRSARKHHMAIVMGFPLRSSEGGIYNALAFIDRDGTIAHIQEKIHLFGEADAAQFSPGRSLCAFDTSLGRMGMQICYDLEFPETSRLLALDGAQLLCAGSANMYPYEQLHTLFVRARATENHLPFIYANAVGREAGFHYCGRSMAADAEGNCLCAGEEQEQLLLAEVTLQEGIRDANLDYLQHRRRDLYRLYSW